MLVKKFTFKTHFKKELDIKQINFIATQLKAKGKSDDEIKQITCNFLGDFVKGLNPKSKQKKTAQDTLENVVAIFGKLSSAADPIRTTALALSEPGVKDYVLKHYEYDFEQHYCFKEVQQCCLFWNRSFQLE